MSLSPPSPCRSKRCPNTKDRHAHRTRAVQIIISREEKNAVWIKEQCILLMDEVKEKAGVSVSGFMMDSASANRAAMALLETQAGPPLIILPCVSLTLSLLIKDLDKKLV